MIALGVWRSVADALGLRMEAPAPKASFGVDVPSELLEAITAGGQIAPRVSRNVALQVPAVLRARNLIAGTLGSLPLTTIGPDKREVPGTYLLGGNIDPDIPNSVMIAQTYEDLLFEGIAWWRVTRFGWHEFPVEARWVPESAVHVAPVGGLLPSQARISEDQPFPAEGQVFIDGIPVPDREVIRFDSPNPPLLRHAARAIRTALKLDTAASVYADEPMPLAVFTPRDASVDRATPDEIEDMLDQWDSARARRATGYVNAALQLETLGWSPEQLQLADARQHAVLEIARAAGLDADYLGVQSGDSDTYANTESRRSDLLAFTLQPYVKAIEDRLSMRDVLPRGYTARVKFDAFLRSDTKTRMETYKIGREINAITEDEMRDAEDRPRLTSSQQPAPQPSPDETVPQMGADDMPAAAFSLDLPAHWDFAVDTPPWGSITEGDYTPEQYRRACLIDTGVGETDSKARYKLPVKTPGGALHRGGVHAAAAALAGARGGLKVTPEQKARAARALVRLYGEINEEPPESLRRLAGQSAAASSDHPLLSFDDPDAYATFRVNEDKRTISGMVVPWGKVAVSGGTRWRFAENSLRWTDASRIKLNLGHDRVQSVGYAAALRNTSRGLDVTFKIADVPEGDRALALAAGKAWDGLSIEIDFEDDFGDDWQADPADRSTRLVRQAKLTHVALTPAPAFDDARVAAVAASHPLDAGGINGHQGDSRPDGPAGRRSPTVRVQLRRVHQDPG